MVIAEQRWGVALVLFVLIGMTSLDAAANAAMPWDPGDPLAEPIGRIRGLEISNETLVVDARAFADGGDAKITATYQILCTAADGIDVDLVFVSPGIENGQVRLDDVVVPSRPEGIDALPKSWRSPSYTPDGVVGHLRHAAQIERVLAFGVAFSRGAHELTVSYVARPTLHHDETLVAMQLAYVLAPARDWQAFGKLDVEVLAPSGWSLVSSPTLTPQGDRWSQTFDGIPADALSMTLRPPRPWGRESLAWLGLVLGLLGCAIGGHRAGQRLGRRFEGCVPAVAGAFVLGAIGAAVVVAGWYAGLAVRDATLPSELLARDTDYGALGVAALGILGGFALTSASVAFGRSHALRSF